MNPNKKSKPKSKTRSSSTRPQTSKTQMSKPQMGRAAGASGGKFSSHNRPSSLKLTKNQRWVVGNHAVLELFNTRSNTVEKVFFQHGWQGVHLQKELFSKAKSLGLDIEEKPRGFLDQIYMNHQGCVVLAQGRPEFIEAHLTNPSQLIFLDGIEDPHNLGAITRTAWLLSVHGIFIPEDRAVDLTPTVHKVACGGVEHVPIVQEIQFKTPIEKFKEMGYWVFGLSHKAKKTIYECQLPRQVIWCIGAEDKGLRTTTE
ncbi:MAG: RNA methyltransferase, partial [Bdellovibrionales bacterium]|nr:RNA methyltransferase [Bdellovibrionales bacterium]